MVKTQVFGLILSVLPGLFLWPCRGAAAREVTVAYDAKSPTKGIQEAIDAVTRGGGVYVPAGRYVLARTILVAGDITLRGAGNQTVLEVEDEYSSELTEDAAAGRSSILVKDPSRFKAGDPVIVSGSGSKAVRTEVKQIHGNEIILTSALTATCEVERHAKAIHTFSALRSRGRINDFTLRDMRVVGGLRNNYQGFSTWRDNSLIFLEGANIRIMNVETADAAGDAICVNGDGNYIIKDCRVTNSRLRGIHIGNDPSDVIISGNIIRTSGLFGIYLCNGCRRTNITGNTISNVGYYVTDHGEIETPYQNPRDLFLVNTRISAIGGLGGGGLKDRYNNISNNIVENSRGSGISFLRWSGELRPGKHINIVANNIYAIAHSAIYVFAAEGINVQDNLVANSGVGTTVLKSMYCNIRNNLIQDCKTGIDVFSDEEGLQSQYNIIAGNSLVKCDEALRLGKLASRNRLEHNYIIMGVQN